MKKQVVGFVATCQCGEVVGAMDFARTNRQAAGRILGKWLHDGCTVEPRFDCSWSQRVAACRCEREDG